MAAQGALLAVAVERDLRTRGVGVARALLDAVAEPQQREPAVGVTTLCLLASVERLGGGFACKQVAEVTCAGSGVAPSGSGTAEPGGTTTIDGKEVPVDPSTVDAGADCSPVSDTFACQPLKLACQTDSDCPSPLDCVDNPALACASPASPPNADGGTADAKPMLPPDCVLPAGAPARVCSVPSWYWPSTPIDGNAATPAIAEDSDQGNTGGTTHGTDATGTSKTADAGIAEAGDVAETPVHDGCALAGEDSSRGNLSRLVSLGLVLGLRARRRRGR